jgi:multiple sugar transport system ATP-binding protein
MAVVQTRGLTKVFRPGQPGAVVGVDLESREGEFLVLLGPSGSGKTTLLRMIAGLEEPTSGEILIGGSVVNDRTPRERRIAMVFQSYALYPHLTVRGNIVFPLKAQGVARAERETKARWAADLLGIGPLLDRRPRELSGGERQRVALARAIVREPTVFLLDEPLSNLDAKLRASAREELEQFQRRVGTTMIYVTHDQVEAMAMGDRVVVMHKGVVRQIGTPAEVYDDPADTFVATFLGSPPMNLVESEDATVGFRPEHFLPAGFTAASGPGVPLSFRFDHEEYLGSERIFYGRVEGGRFDGKRAVSRVPASHRTPMPPDSVHRFEVAEGNLKFFDRDTGTRRGPVRIA